MADEVVTPSAAPREPTIRSSIRDLAGVDAWFRASTADAITTDQYVLIIKAAEDILKLAGAR